MAGVGIVCLVIGAVFAFRGFHLYGAGHQDVLADPGDPDAGGFSGLVARYDAAIAALALLGATVCFVMVAVGARHHRR